MKLVEKDVLHLSFYLDNIYIYHYTLMLFGLINVGALSQRMLNKFFTDMIGVTMEAYVKDMLVKSKACVNHQIYFP